MLLLTDIYFIFQSCVVMTSADVNIQWWTYASILVCIYLGRELLRQRVLYCFIKYCYMFFRKALQIYTSTSRVWEFQLLHILMNIWICQVYLFIFLILAISVDLYLYFMFSIYISLVTNEGEHISYVIQPDIPFLMFKSSIFLFECFFLKICRDFCILLVSVLCQLYVSKISLMLDVIIERLDLAVIAINI